MASKLKMGIHGVTQPRITDGILGAVIIDNRPPFNNIEGEITSKCNNQLKYLTVQIQSEYPGRVYIINVLAEQCKSIKWRHKRYSVEFDRNNV